MEITISPSEVRMSKARRMFFLSILSFGFVLFRLYFDPAVRAETVVTFLGLGVLCAIYGAWSYKTERPSRYL